MQRIVWIQFYSRESRKANDESVRAEELGGAFKMKLPQELSDVADVQDYIFDHDKFKKLFADIRSDEIYVYRDADCKDRVPLDEMLSDIQTSASQPLRFVRPGRGSSYPYAGSFDVYFDSFRHPIPIGQLPYKPHCGWHRPLSQMP